MSRRVLLAAIACLAAAAEGGAAVPEFVSPPPETRTLENGLQVVVFHRPRLPLVQMQLRVDAGAVTEPDDAPGVALATARLLTRGTSSRSKAAFLIEVDRLAGTVEAAAARDFASLDAAFLARDFDAGIELLSDAALNPIFPEAEVGDVQGSLLQALASIRRNPGLLADEQLWAALFPDHPYGRPLSGTPGSLARLSRDKVQAFYLERYRPDRASLVIAGDVAPERAFAAAEEWFGRWRVKARGGAARTPAMPVRAPRVTVRLVDAPGMPETQVRVGLQAPARGSDDEPAFALANVLFGGAPSSRLARAPGLGARGARSTYALLREGGVLAVSWTAENDSVGALVARLRSELRAFAASPPAPAEVAQARTAARRVHPMRFETLGGLIGHGSGAGRFQEELQRYLERLAAVDRERLQAVAARWLDPGRMTVVAVGPAAAIQAQLESFGDVEIVRFDDAPGAAPAPAPPPTPEQAAEGRRIVQRAIAAHGGLARLQRIQDSTVEAEAILSFGDQETRAEIIQVRKEPDRMLYTTRFNNLEMVQALTGNVGWVSGEASGQTRPMDSLSVAAMRAGFGADLPHLLLAAHAPESRVASRGRDSVAGREVLTVEVVAGPDRRVLHFDARDHRLVAMDQADGAGGGTTARRLYRDYRAVQGILWPFVEERRLGERRVLLMTVRRVALNTGVRDEHFERHPTQSQLPAR